MKQRDEDENKKSLEEKHFGKHGANGKYPCLRDDYNWGTHRPSVPDSRVVTKDNTVIHGLEEDAKNFEQEGNKYNTYFHHQMAADYWQMAAERREEIMKYYPQLIDKNHQKAADFCLNRMKENLILAQKYWDGEESIFETDNTLSLEQQPNKNDEKPPLGNLDEEEHSESTE